MTYKISDMRDSGDDVDNSDPKFTHRFSLVFSFDSDSENAEDYSDEFLIEKIREAMNTGRFAGFEWESTVQNHK